LLGWQLEAITDAEPGLDMGRPGRVGLEPLRSAPQDEIQRNINLTDRSAGLSVKISSYISVS
jgi:hypothetical protein